MGELHIASADATAAECAALLRRRDPVWCDALHNLENETSRGLLGPKITVLVQLVIHASITGLSTSQTRRYVARAVELGTSSDEILAVFKLCAVIGIHSMATAMPILDERLEQAMPKSDSGTPQTPTIETLRRRGKFNQAW